MPLLFFLVFSVLGVFPLFLAAGEAVTSEPGLAFPSPGEGFSLVPAEPPELPRGPDDLAPPLRFEIVRPAARAIRIGRILSSCGCLRVTAQQREYRGGERAFVEVRNIKPTPPEGGTFAIFLQLVEPEVTLELDVFVRSQP